MSFFEVIMSDLRLAFRALRTTPVVSVVAALSLALGVGANTAIFSLINSLLLRALPVKAPQQLAVLAEKSPIPGRIRSGLRFVVAPICSKARRRGPLSALICRRPARPITSKVYGRAAATSKPSACPP